MGNTEAQQRALENEVLEGLKRRQSADTPGSDTNVITAGTQRVKNAISAISGDPSGAAKEQLNNYFSQIKNNTKLRKVRGILERLVDEKRKKKSAKTGMSYDDVKKAGKEAAGKRRMKWDGNDTWQLLYGGPIGLIGSAVRHKRQNDIYDLEDEYHQLEDEGYGYPFFEKKRGRKGRSKKKIEGGKRIDVTWAGIYPPGDERWETMRNFPYRVTTI